MTEKRRIGLDIGGVILKRHTHNTREWVEGAKEGLKMLCKRYPNSIFLISRVNRRGSITEQKTMQFFIENNVFNEIGLKEKNIFFVEEPLEKLEIAKQLNLDTFIDDRFDVLEPMVGIIPHLYILNSQYRCGQKGIILVKRWEELIDNLFPDILKRKKERMSKVYSLIDRFYYYQHCEAILFEQRMIAIEECEKQKFLKDYEICLRRKNIAYKRVIVGAKRLKILEKISGITDSEELKMAILNALQGRERAFFDVFCRILDINTEREIFDVPLPAPDKNWWLETKKLLLEFDIPEPKIDYFYDVHYMCQNTTPSIANKNEVKAREVADEIYDLLLKFIE